SAFFRQDNDRKYRQSLDRRTRSKFAIFFSLFHLKNGFQPVNRSNCLRISSPTCLAGGPVSKIVSFISKNRSTLKSAPRLVWRGFGPVDRFNRFFLVLKNNSLDLVRPKAVWFLSSFFPDSTRLHIVRIQFDCQASCRQITRLALLVFFPRSLIV